MGTKATLATACFVFSTPALAQNCATIPDAAARLACFDKSSKTPAMPSPTPKAKGDANGFQDNGWQLNIRKDGFTDKTSCVISPIGKPYVQITVGNLYISYAGRGGVQGFTVRLDDRPPGSMQLPTPVEQRIGAVHLGGANFFDAMQAERIRIQTFTVLSELKDEDLQLAPAKRLYKKIPPECERG